MPEYIYEAFISYAHADRHWGEKLYSALNQPNFPVFRDEEGLMPGRQFDNQLKEALHRSRCLIVLWSSTAMTRQWVWEEINMFKSENRGLPIYVLLDIDNEVDPLNQAITDLKTRGAYNENAEMYPAKDWDLLINKIRKAIYQIKGSRPIKRAVFTLTQDKVQASGTLPLETIQRVSLNYGARYADWRPFGMHETIEKILDDLLYADVNPRIKDTGTSFHWDDIDWKENTSALWLPRLVNRRFIDANVNATAAEIDKLKADLCVVVLDPLALDDATVKDRFVVAWDKCRSNSQSLIMALHPYDITQDLTLMRQQLQSASTFYDNYFDPPMLVELKSAECFASTLDSLEMKRNLRVSLRKHIPRSQERENRANAFTNI